MRRPLCCSRRFLDTMITFRRRHVIVIIASGLHLRGVEAANQKPGQRGSQSDHLQYFSLHRLPKEEILRDLTRQNTDKNTSARFVPHV